MILDYYLRSFAANKLFLCREKLYLAPSVVTIPCDDVMEHPEQGPSSSFRDLLHLRTQYLAHTKRRVPKSGSSGTAARFPGRSARNPPEWLRPALDATHLPPRVASQAGLNHSGGLAHPMRSLYRVMEGLSRSTYVLRSNKILLDP